MKLNAQQAADILGVSRDRVKTFVGKGFLKDLREKKEGAKKHYIQLDAKEVREFKKSEEFQKVRNIRYLNGHGSHPAIKVESLKVESTPKAGIFTLLEEMNAKIDQLLKIWS